MDWLIYKRDRGGFYRPNAQGYCREAHDAGRFSKERAEAECRIEPGNIIAVPAPLEL